MNTAIRVLHVDDEADFTELAATFLEQEEDRIEVFQATSASEGLALVAEHQIDCVVSDYDMPGKSGIEFLKTVRETDSELPFILFTGKGSEEVASTAIASGVTDYLQKGFGSEQYELLANRITNAVEQHRSAQRASELERIRRVIKNLNKALARARTRDETEDRICQIISDAEPYLFAWIAKADSATDSITSTASAGTDRGYLDTIELTTTEQPSGQGPTGKAFRSRELVVVQNISENAEYEPWRADALERGYASSAAIPLVHGDTLYGVLNVYADRTRAFDDEEQDLLQEIADDAAHALHDIGYRERLQAYGRIVDKLPVGVYRATSGPEGEVIEVNPALVDLMNANSPDQLEGRTVSSFYRNPAERGVLSDKIQSEGLVDGEELRLVAVDGTEIWISVTAIPTEENGEIYFDGIIQDITERKERERELQLFREAVEASGHSIYFTDSEGAIEYVNPAFEEITGYSFEEVRGRTPRILKSGDHDQDFYETLWETVLGGDVWRNQLVNSTKSGDRYIVDQTIAPLTGASGEIEHFVAVNADVTRRTAREEKLEAMQRRHTAVLENTTTPIFMKDDHGEYVFVNQGYRDLFDLQDAEIVGRTAHEIHPPEMADEVQENDQTVIDRGESIEIEEQILVDGERRTFLASKVPIYNSGDRSNEEEPVAVFGVAVDVTERTERERDVQRERNRLDEFAGLVSHDLRNPLNVIEGRLELAREGCDSEHLEQVDAALERMGRIIDDVLWLAQEGKDIGTTDPVDLQEALETAWMIVGDNSPETEFVQATGGPQSVEADDDRLAQLLENLFRNAIEHGGENATIKVGELTDGFYVEDDGPGIPEESRGDVFKAGYSTLESGTGFGLSIVKAVVEAHDWSIRLTESAEGGARFEITGVEFVAE